MCQQHWAYTNMNVFPALLVRINMWCLLQAHCSIVYLSEIMDGEALQKRNNYKFLEYGQAVIIHILQQDQRHRISWSDELGYCIEGRLEVFLTNMNHKKEKMTLKHSFSEARMIFLGVGSIVSRIDCLRQISCSSVNTILNYKCILVFHKKTLKIEPSVVTTISWSYNWLIPCMRSGEQSRTRWSLRLVINHNPPSTMNCVKRKQNL